MAIQAMDDPDPITYKPLEQQPPPIQDPPLYSDTTMTSKPPHNQIEHLANSPHNGAPSPENKSDPSYSYSYLTPTASSTSTSTSTNKPTASTTITLSLLLAYFLTFLDTYVLPPHIREAIIRTARSHPALASFLAIQFLCSCVPVGILFVGALISACMAAVVFTCVVLVVLGPVMVATTVTGVFIWGTAWGVFLVGRWGLGLYIGSRGK